MNFDAWAEDLAKHVGNKNPGPVINPQPAAWNGWQFPETHPNPPSNRLCIILIQGIGKLAAPTGIPFIKFGYYVDTTMAPARVRLVGDDHWCYFDSDGKHNVLIEKDHRVCAWTELSLEAVFPVLPLWMP